MIRREAWYIEAITEAEQRRLRVLLEQGVISPEEYSRQVGRAGLTEFYNFGRGPVPAHRHINPDGSIGGWVAESASVSPGVTVGKDAQVANKATVLHWAKVLDNAKVSGLAQVHGESEVSGNARVFGKARVYDTARVYGNAQVYGEAVVTDWARVYENARVYGRARIMFGAKIYGRAQVYEKAQLWHDVEAFGEAKIHGEAKLIGKSKIDYETTLHNYKTGVSLRSEIITEVIEGVVNDLLEDGIPDRRSISRGNCGEFATMVWERLRDTHPEIAQDIKIHWDDDDGMICEGGRGPGIHMILVDTKEGKYYDSDTPRGVNSWRQLPIFKDKK